MSKKVYEIVTQKILAQIDEAIKNNTCPSWQKCWTSDTLPINHITGKAYRGINTLLLFDPSKPDEPNEFLTWSQYLDLKKHNPEIKLRKGSKANMVVFFSFKETTKDVIDTTSGEVTQKEIKIPFLKYYNVFSISDIDGLTPKRKKVTFDNSPIEAVENVVNNYISHEGVRIQHVKGDKAYYSPSQDKIVINPIENFISAESYYACLLHELSHSTGNAKRLNRIKNDACFGSEEYSKEELVAEISASMLCGVCHIDTKDVFNNSVAYLNGWMNAIRKDITLIVSACAKAQKSADLILGVNQEQDI